jgi:hypothetical protein
MAAYYSAKGHKVEQMSFFTVQHTELQAVIMACCDFPTEAINVSTDSAYVAGVLCAIETAYIGHTNNEELFHMFCQLRASLQAHHHSYFVGHVHSHSSLLGPLAEVNQNADELDSSSCLLGHVKPCAPGSAVTQAVKSHILCHQNSNALHKQFHLTRKQA